MIFLIFIKSVIINLKFILLWEILPYNIGLLVFINTKLAYVNLVFDHVIIFHLLVFL
jgi:hypothetical protein